MDQALRYGAATRAGKSQILDAVCAVTGFDRDYARRALTAALTPQVVRPRVPRLPVYDADDVAALETYWAVTSAPGRSAAGADLGRAGAGAAPVR